MIRLYDTARREIVPFEPGELVTLYSCGITPYDSAHLGHAQVYLTFDILQRRLRDLGHETRCVRNITDVDDDILRKARELGVHYLDLAAEEIARFDRDMESLGLIPSWSEPRATSAIAEILTLIGAVLDSGNAYQSGGAVYFDVTTFPRLRRGEPLRPRHHAGHGRRARRATPTTRTSAIRSTSCCGSRRCPTSRRGSRGGDRAGPAGTSSARPWCCASSARPSTSTAVDATWSSPTTSARRPSPRRPPARRSCATGCTWGWSVSTAPRCRSRSATWSSWATS